MRPGGHPAKWRCSASVLAQLNPGNWLARTLCLTLVSTRAVVSAAELQRRPAVQRPGCRWAGQRGHAAPERPAPPAIHGGWACCCCVLELSMARPAWPLVPAGRRLPSSTGLAHRFHRRLGYVRHQPSPGHCFYRSPLTARPDVPVFRPKRMCCRLARSTRPLACFMSTPSCAAAGGWWWLPAALQVGNRTTVRLGQLGRASPPGRDGLK